MVHRKSSRINLFLRTLFRRLAALVLIAVVGVILSAVWIQLGRGDRAVEIIRPDTSLPAPAVAPDSLRLVTYNIAHARGPGLDLPNTAGGSPEERRARLTRIGEALRNTRADLIFLQEVDFNCWWSHGMDQSEVIATAAGLPYRVTQRNVDTGLHFWRRWEFGNVLLSRLPILEAEKLDLPPYSDVEKLVAGNHDALMAVVDLGGGELLRVIGAHLEVRSEETRVQAAQELISTQRRFSEPLILLGDLNSTPPGFPDSQTSRLGQNTIELLESFGGFQLRPTRGRATHRDFTFPSEAPRRIIDWILPDQNFRITEYVVLRNINESDHFPVLATLRRR
jgi:endonuclease/exonuclease/phosphatase family metal-dependent hydrolase